MTTTARDDDARLEELLRPLLRIQPVTRRTRLRRRRRLVAVAAALIAALGAAATVAAATVGVGPLHDALTGPAAPEDKQDALRGLFPPLKIGPARVLAEHDGRTLYGARTARGGYCFSATSPVDPQAEGGHCVSTAEARRLDRHGTVAFAMSGSSVGGYARGAEAVRITGAGLDVRVPVNPAGWWIGVAELRRPPLPDGVDADDVVASAFGRDGESLGDYVLLRITRRAGGVFVIVMS